MSVMESGPDATPETVTRFLNQLTAALVDRGLVAEVFGARMVWAKNPAADPPSGEPQAAAMSPGLRQAVVCQHDQHSGGLAWYWLWSGTTRDAPPEAEYLCPAEDVNQAADRITRVLRLDRADSGNPV
ncbi:hypothetical protein NE235_13320 [Actinoallomurus spadix]|uniref:Uncharacterized protein n=1 Tax=Actinoallomurus spadix TaxID=79912 RepID=A0ABN0WD17_9ACTN|nr:hypothetical protein [Actinoallomurus spadix]MCO5987081.1 hypothetical protein [Actinoallomurus spadix]